MRKLKFCFLAMFLILVLCVFGAKSFGDDATLNSSTYSDKGESNVGAWYDEVWLASGFYLLSQIGSSNNYRYEYTTTGATGTFIKDPDSKDTSNAGTPSHKHTYNASGASMPQDIVVTEWKVTGHVHFSSGL